MLILDTLRARRRERMLATLLAADLPVLTDVIDRALVVGEDGEPVDMHLSLEVRPWRAIAAEHEMDPEAVQRIYWALLDAYEVTGLDPRLWPRLLNLTNDPARLGLLVGAQPTSAVVGEWEASGLPDDQTLAGLAA